MKAKQKPIRFSLRDLTNYACDKTILARVIHDQSVKPLLARMTGKTLELGAGSHDYSIFAVGCSEYLRSDYNPPRGDNRLKIDATAIDFPDESLDGVVCMSALEHIQAYEQVLAEVWRVLKPGGRFLLCVPWVFPFHGAPDDFHRFSPSALQSLLAGYQLEEFEAVGNQWLTHATFLQRPKWSRGESSISTRFYDPLLRLVGLVFMLAGGGCTEGDDNYALLYTCLCRKPL